MKLTTKQLEEEEEKLQHRHSIRLTRMFNKFGETHTRRLLKILL